jgi:predicted dehydrogenase
MKKKINIIILGEGRQAKFYKKILCKKKYINLINNKNKKYTFKESIKEKIDLAIVANATPYHFKSLNFLLSKDVNILCEKPFCSNYEQAYKIYKNSKKYKKLFYLNYQFRFESHIQFIKKLIISKKLGKIRSVKIDWITNQKKGDDRLYSFKNSFKSG